MEPISIKGTSETPKIILDKEQGAFIFEGSSLPENARVFYHEVLEWLDEYARAPNNKTTVHMRFNYVNTASTKIIMMIFERFELIHKENNDIKIIWYYENDDEEILEMGEEFQSIINVPMEFEVLTTPE